jgi:hypothetical protein
MLIPQAAGDWDYLPPAVAPDEGLRLVRSLATVMSPRATIDACDLLLSVAERMAGDLSGGSSRTHGYR